MHMLMKKWLLLIVASPLLLSHAVAAESCDRACLKQALDAYLAAVLKHDPAAAPLASNHRATENAVDVKPGEGIWRTASALGKVQRQYFDSVNSQAAYLGHLQEGDATDIVSVRIKVVDKLISEAEWTIARKGYFGMFDTDGLTTYPPPPMGAIPKKQRMSRFQMVALGNGYFQGLQDHDGSMLPAEDNCERVENGVKVTHRRRSEGPPGGPPAAAASSSAGGAPTAAQEELSGNCVANFEIFKNTIAEASLRRFPLIDEEQGVVMSMTVFRRPASSTMRRNLLTEYFYMRSGKLTGIWAAMYYLDPSAPFSSGWNN